MSGSGNRFTRDLPTSIINNYRKSFSDSNDTVNGVFNPSQQRLGDTTDSIKRYLEKILVTFPVLDGVLIQDYNYTTPKEVVYLRHNLGRPYKGMDIISLTAPPPFKLQAFKNAGQAVTAGTTVTVTWITNSTFDPFGSMSGSVITPPFYCYCDFTITIHRDYAFGAVLAPTYDEFWLRNITAGATLGSRKRLYRQTATTSLLENNETLVCMDKTFDDTNTYDVRFECNAFNQNILYNTDNVTQLYIVENKSANPRIDTDSDISESGFDRSYFVPVISDKACKFTCVVW